MTRILLLAACFCICSHQIIARTGAQSERSVLQRSTDPQGRTEISTMLRGSVRYLGVDDLARFAGARTYVNTVLKKIEIILPSVRFKCTAESPFVIITHERDGSQSVCQLTSPVSLNDGAFILPASAFLEVFENETHLKITLSSGDMPARKPAVIAGPAPQKQSGIAPHKESVVTEPKESVVVHADQISLGTAEKSGKYSVTGLAVEEKRNGYLLRIRTSERLPDAEKVLQGGEWLYLTIPKGRGSVSTLAGVFPTGLVKRVIPVQTAQALQLTFQLREKVESAEIIPPGEDTDILIALRMKTKSQSDPVKKVETDARTSKPKQGSGTHTAPSKPEAEILAPPTKPDADVPTSLSTPTTSTHLSASNPATEESTGGAPQADETVAAVKQPNAIESMAERQKNKWKLDVIVLDAGHGGHDPGTIGSRGTREKDVTLGIALKLGALIQKQMPGVKVVYTRKTDDFVELYRRGQIANEAGGKLFISIHCNSTPKKSTPINGFEIYLLRPGKTDNAIAIAEQENSVVRLEKDYENRYQALTEENYIILTMAQSAYVKQSERFAEILESEMAKKMVYQSRGVKQAGFYVLVGASMPNILVETGYLSNAKDETLLRGLAGQYLAAQSIFDGLKKFKAEYERNFAQD